MAHAKLLPQNVLEAIARQVSERLAPAAVAALPPGSALSIAETFPVWMLGLDATTRADEKLSTLAVNTGDWHHQIHSPTGEHTTCRSTANGPNPEDWQILSLSRSPDLAKKIDQAIEWIDKNVSDDPEARILKIPSYYITAFWLVFPDKDAIALVDAPRTYKTIQYQHLYLSKEFLKLLAGERHAQGVPQP